MNKLSTFNENGYPNRKPDFEVESFRSWTVDKSEEKEFAKVLANDKGAINLSYKDIEVSLGGFTKCINKTTGVLEFAYKIKSTDKLILFYLADKNSDIAKEGVKLLGQLSAHLDYEFLDAMDCVKNIYNEKDRLELKTTQ